VSPSGPVTQDRTARRLRAVVDAEDGAHHLASARIASGRSVRITYDGGTRGISPRSITPRRFQQKGGVAYVVAYCHLDSLEKSFRLDRIRHCEVLAAAEPCGHHVDPETLNR